MDCIFCQIVQGKVPSDTVYEDDEIKAFRDIHPVSPTHILIIPKRHITSLADLPDEETPLVGRMVRVANELARKEGVARKGYRIIISSGEEGGQVVPHLHMHLLGGRKLSDRLC
jgi:histidine triad (HIT) family protein